MNLNEQQMLAVKHINGPMLVLAGAGSGKTKVLTNRIAYLIENGVSPYNILAITFTNKAAKEMQQRVCSLIGSSASKVQISTFHSFGLKMIKENYEILGYDKNFSILDSDDSLSVIKKIMKEYNMDFKFYNPKSIRNKISSAKNELISSSKFSQIEFDKLIVNTYSRYERILKGNISSESEDDISSSGYVVSTLEAVMWLFLNSKDYNSTILKAVNLGNDTDTIAAITGSLLGIYYGLNSIKDKWKLSLKKHDYIIDLCKKFEEML